MSKGLKLVKTCS